MTSVDLDDAVARIRAPGAKKYMQEALAAYRAGAYRATIIMVWISVCIDLFEKIAELASQNDSAALAEQQKIEAATRARNVDGLLRIERELVATCREKLSIISLEDEKLLLRLREDRHTCATPPFQKLANYLIRPLKLVGCI